MKREERLKKLTAIKNELSLNLMPGGFVKNIGNVFFRLYDSGCVLRDVVYYWTLRHGLEFELISLDGQYFAGSKEHAEALQEHYGGSVFQSEYCHLSENPRDLWIWQLPIPPENRTIHGINKKPLDYDEVAAVLFDIV